ncbi:unnamed protein product [Acanthoscelides obtectus]|uniref:Uncharacterized protein n=1 Tax=Acanthoscelides obtectus TaxID=200917 RepID=A0A9P0Q1G5_ACAOB|nr:unnamed protein product [Acanthoscelides obtectus]CAK1623236.1 hypothetical protein AOBTE_LOCUS1899 [Acanthoscelides obtectus]
MTVCVLFQNPQQRQYPSMMPPRHGGVEEYPPRGMYRPSPAQMVPGSTGSTGGSRVRPMGGNLQSSLGGNPAASRRHLQQQGLGARRT